jgi:hypothetical protein
MYYVTCHIQKDKRVNLGTTVHSNRDCSSLKGRTGVTTIAGDIVQLIPKCYYCSGGDHNFKRSVYDPQVFETRPK